MPSAAVLMLRRLEIAMDDALLVRGFERLGDLPRDRQRLVQRDRARAMRSESVALDEFQHERREVPASRLSSRP